MNIKFFPTQFLVILGLIFLFGRSATACTCDQITVTQQRNDAKAVFIGTVLKKARSDAVSTNGVAVTFKVRRVWKGDVSKTVLVYTGATADLYPFEDMCAPNFKVGKEYVVFALGGEKLETDICTGTTDVKYAAPTIKELGPGKNKPVTKAKSAGMRRLLTRRCI